MELADTGGLNPPSSQEECGFKSRPGHDAAMDDLGFVRADSASTASVLVRPIPDDRFDRDSELREGTRIASLLHLVADLIDLGGDDRADAAERFASIYRLGPS